MSRQESIPLTVYGDLFLLLSSLDEIYTELLFPQHILLRKQVPHKKLLSTKLYCCLTRLEWRLAEV